MKAFANSSVAAVFDAYPSAVRRKLLRLRELIFETAKQTPEVGEIEETLKWGQPSYLTTETKSGSTIRIGALASRPGHYALYVHCQTTLVSDFRKRFGETFSYDGNRSLIFSAKETIPEPELRDCIRAALTYHLSKRKNKAPIGALIRKYIN